MTDAAAVASAANAAIGQMGGVDILVNNAGITGPNAQTWEYPPDEWRKVIDIDLTGAVPVLPRRRPAHDRRKLRPHRQHRLDRRQGRQPQRRPLLAPPKPA